MDFCNIKISKMALCDQIKMLYKNGLHSSVVNFGSMVVSIGDNQGDVSPCDRYQSMVILGCSLQCLHHYKKAEVVLKRAIQFAKNLLTAKSVKATDLYTDGTTEIDVKCALAECHIANGQQSLALSVLETVPSRCRNSRLNMMIATLYQQTGNERPAITAYKEVLKECPCAVDAAEKLVELGVSGSEVLLCMVAGAGEVGATVPPPDWLVSFVKALGCRYGGDYSSAVATLQQLEESTPLRRNTHLLATLGETHYFAGDQRHALTTLQRVRELDPVSMEGVELLGALYYTDKRVKDLEKLAASVSEETTSFPHPWILMGYYCHLSKRTTKAIYFAHKACSLDKYSVEALLLKGSLLLEMKKLSEAVQHFKQANLLAPRRFEPYKGTVECYLAMHRNREAVNIALTVNKLLGQNARSLTLYASVLLKDAIDVNKGKNLLEKAIKEDPYYLPAVFLLADVYSGERRFERATELLLRQVNVQSGCRVHERLAELYKKQYHQEEANYHHSVAVKYSTQGESVEGGGGVSGGALDAATDSPASPDLPAYDMDVEDISDSEGDVELSDLETVWSDGDFSFTGQ